jgi:hypothetical protein
MLERLKLRAILWFFYVLGALVRRFTRDPLADFFTEMEKSGRLNIKETSQTTGYEPAKPTGS